MFCYHCAKEINEAKVESKQTNNQVIESDGDVDIQYICPRCGHLIKKNLTEDETKQLARASHSEIQRGSNSYALGMSFVQIGIILLTIGSIFFILSLKPTEFTLVDIYSDSLAMRYNYFVGFKISLLVSICLFALAAIAAIINHYTKLKFPKIERALVASSCILGGVGIIAAFVCFVLAHNPNSIQIKNPTTGETITEVVTFAWITKHVEFWVFIVCGAIAVTLLIAGLVDICLGVYRKYKYNNLLEDINNKTFVQ